MKFVIEFTGFTFDSLVLSHNTYTTISLKKLIIIDMKKIIIVFGIIIILLLISYVYVIMLN